MNAVGPWPRIHCLTSNARNEPMMVSVTHLQAALAILAGILILIKPEILNYVVAIYLILVGLLVLI
jgi:hypothetical protein